MMDIAFALWCIICAAFVGVVVGSSVTHAVIYVPVDECRQEHNVYQCELVAVPVAAPTWVQK